jgi:hypothetical protein
LKKDLLAANQARRSMPSKAIIICHAHVSTQHRLSAVLPIVDPADIAEVLLHVHSMKKTTPLSPTSRVFL